VPITRPGDRVIGPAAIVAALLAAGPATAQMFCSPPREPSCIETLRWSRDEFAFQLCRMEVEAFRREVRDYLRCLADEGNRAIRDLDRAIDRFNCHARGGSFCP
jgi:hypothetical protein